VISKNKSIGIRFKFVIGAILTSLLLPAFAASAAPSVSQGSSCKVMNKGDKKSGLICMPTKGNVKKLTMQKNVPNSNKDGVTKTSIKIGMMGDFTGPTASAQAYNMRGQTSFWEWVNATGGLLGRKVQFIAKDDKYGADAATVNFDNLVNTDKVLTIAGMGGSHISAILDKKMTSFGKNGLVIVGAHQTTNIEIMSKNYFSNMEAYGDIADVAIAKCLEEVNGKAANLKVASYVLEVPSGAEFAAYMKKKTVEKGGTYVGGVTAPGSATDHTAAVAKLKSLISSGGVNCIGLHGSPGFGKLFADAMSKAGVVDIPILGIHGIASPVIFESAPKGIAKQILGIHSFAGTGSAPGLVTIKKWMAGKQWEGDVGVSNFIHGWVDGMIVKAAVEKAWTTGKVTRATFRNALKSKFDTQGLTCPIDWTKIQYSPCAAPLNWVASRGLEVDSSFAYWQKFLTKDYSL
jgi:branched-chain amino acid transport system substrate-binding protein